MKAPSGEGAVELPPALPAPPGVAERSALAPGLGPPPPRPLWALLRGILSPLALVVGLLALVLFSPLIGPERLPPLQVLSILLHQSTAGALGGTACNGSVAPSQCRIWVEIVWDARVPAVLLAVLVGASLGLSGAGLQGLFRNSLADPFLLGLSAGAALGAAAAFTVTLSPGGSSVAATLLPTDPALLLPTAAFLGGLVPGSVVLLASYGRYRSPQTLLLTGIALNALFSAILSTMLLYYPGINLQLTFWLLGGFPYATWSNDGLVLSVLIVAGLLLVLHGRPLNLLQMGEDVAQSLGIDPRRVARRVMLLATVATAVAVAFAGIVGFVGLVSPHVVRRFVGVDYRRVLPLSMVAGAGFLLIAWDAAETVIPAAVIPVGIPTAFVGSSFFLYLLQRRPPPSERGA